MSWFSVWYLDRTINEYHSILFRHTPSRSYRVLSRQARAVLIRTLRIFAAFFCSRRYGIIKDHCDEYKPAIFGTHGPGKALYY